MVFTWLAQHSAWIGPTVGAGLLVGMAAPAAAHPHIWIDATTTVVVDGGKIVALELRWRFDPMFSAFVIGEYDADRDNAISPDENERIRTGAFELLRDVGYFVHLRADGQPVKVGEAQRFAASYVGGDLVYSFVLPLAAPLDPQHSRIDVGVYDEEYFIDIAHEKTEPVRFVGAAPNTCRYDIRADTGRTIYMGLLHPQTVHVSCGAT